VHERVEWTKSPHGIVERGFDDGGVVQKVDPDGGTSGSGRRDGVDRRVRRRGAIGNRDAPETVACQRGSDAGGETTGRSRHERAAIQSVTRGQTSS
jgi:hypothetical protein